MQTIREKDTGVKKKRGVQSRLQRTKGTADQTARKYYTRPGDIFCLDFGKRRFYKFGNFLKEARSKP